MRQNFPFLLFPNLITYPPNNNAGCLPGKGDPQFSAPTSIAYPFLNNLAVTQKSWARSLWAVGVTKFIFQPNAEESRH